MEEKRKRTLTEELKVKETEANNLKHELLMLNGKLQNSLQYEDELAVRVSAAKKNSQELLMQAIKKSGELTAKLNDMKQIVEVFTGNFYT